MKAAILLPLLMFASPGVSAAADETREPADAQAKKLVEVGNDGDVMRGYELERHEKTSTIRITRKKTPRVGSVGSSLFVVRVVYEVAKARKCEYFTNLAERTDDNGDWIYTAGFTNKKDANIQQEFGEQFSEKNDSGQDRKLLGVSQFAPLFEQKSDDPR